MALELYNTLTRKKELFTPINPSTVGLYHCGPTVYWDQQIGNMRAMVLADFVYRTLKYNGYTATFVRNYTDVGHLTGDNIGDADQGIDRMEKAAERENLLPDMIADKYIKSFDEDVASLHVLTPTHRTRATHYINDMIDMVQALLDKGFAYTTAHAIYFNVSKYPEYMALSGQKLENLETGAGTGTVSDSDKKNPQDFSLWFFKAGVHEKALQTWESPFVSPLVENGRGFPGWHIECSAMSKHHLGSTFDIHMGGIEHIPIHHTNEIAQSECANDAHYVNYWLHNEHLLVDNKKMGKSEGNAYLMKDIIEHGFNPLSLRFFFTQSHYRSRQNFTWESLKASETALERLSEQYRKLGKVTGKINDTYKNEFLNALNDDINIPQAFALVWKLLKDDTLSPADKKSTLDDFDHVLGFNFSSLPEKELIKLPEEILNLIEKRDEARTNKNWKLSDELRTEIETRGYEVKDTPNGTQVVAK
jgi:cysteinyl-tRNA synthetase